MDDAVRPERDTAGHRLLQAAGEVEQNAEDTAIGAATTGVWRFRSRHPFSYALIAFVAGGVVTGLFVVIAYSNWTFEGIDLLAAVYEFVIGSLAGGIIAAVLAYAYARTLRPVVRR